jgi:hypothetical protein
MVTFLGERYLAWPRRAAGLVLVLLVSSGGASCYRYVTTSHPMSAADCPPDPWHAYARYRFDSTMSGGLRGRVVDVSQPDSMKRVNGVAVSIDGHDIGSYVDDSGRFAIPRLAPGRYSVATRRIGFAVRHDSIVVLDHAQTVLDVGLAPAPMDGCPGFAAIIERKRVWRWPWQ